MEHVLDEAWISAQVPVLKARENTPPVIRWCTDFRLSNLDTRKIRVPLPTIDENLEALAGAKIWSSLDSSNAYFA